MELLVYMIRILMSLFIILFCTFNIIVWHNRILSIILCILAVFNLIYSIIIDKIKKGE